MHTLDPLIEWDPDKAKENLKKHGIDFADAATVLDDELGLTIPDDSATEERYVTIGMDALGRVRGERLRLISARRATSGERRQYEDVRS